MNQHKVLGVIVSSWQIGLMAHQLFSHTVPKSKTLKGKCVCSDSPSHETILNDLLNELEGAYVDLDMGILRRYFSLKLTCL